MEEQPMMELWSTAPDVLDPPKDHHKPQPLVPRPPRSINDYLQQVDEVPPNARPTSNRGVLIILEDNDSVIKMCLKQRVSRLKHVPRTHRVDLNTLINQVAKDPQVLMRFIKTYQQAADIFTKGSFNEITWKRLQNLIQLEKAKPRKKAALPPSETSQSKHLSREELPEPTTPTKVKPMTSGQDQTPETLTRKEPTQAFHVKRAVSWNRPKSAATQLGDKTLYGKLYWTIPTETWHLVVRRFQRAHVSMAARLAATRQSGQEANQAENSESPLYSER